MENASKALVIAGAVLVAIVLISIGIYIVGSVKPVVNVAGEAGDKLAVQTYNSTFTKYVGTQKGSTVINLLQDVITNNNKGDNKISVVYDSTLYPETTITTLQSSISRAASYTISITVYNSKGYVSTINIQ